MTEVADPTLRTTSYSSSSLTKQKRVNGNWTNAVDFNDLTTDSVPTDNEIEDTENSTTPAQANEVIVRWDMNESDKQQALKVAADTRAKNDQSIFKKWAEEYNAVHPELKQKIDPNRKVEDMPTKIEPPLHELGTSKTAYDNNGTVNTDNTTMQQQPVPSDKRLKEYNDDEALLKQIMRAKVGY